MKEAIELLREARSILNEGFIDCHGDKCRQLNCIACFGDAAESSDALIRRIDAFLSRPEGGTESRAAGA